MIELTIDGVAMEAEHGELLIEVARRNGIEIPALCYHESVEPYAACRLCLVEVDEGRRTRLVTSCTYPIRFPITVRTQTPKIEKIRKMVLELLLAEAPASERLAELAAAHGVTNTRFQIDEPAGECILCGLCQRVCQDVRHVASINFAYRGTARRVMTPYDEVPALCDGCTACAFVCPTGAVHVTADQGHIGIEPWKSSVDLLHCQECGAEVGAQPIAEAARETLGDRAPAAVLCAACRRKAFARRLVETGTKPSGG